ncbi:hypothetical protein AGDE_15285 [Angomonas deanei]|uniref:Uncharacterized protein n=1 Tax=Angomonas deanei TaxID=59799 RepID=A0A7G2CPS7_9TRYP|nr:hypothetical protein AGDE_15285 [Angomonas deanei]CAD2220974.1 hypothetical protein, conserved [Angomonas deanei]|eukprot:EPY19349.1 hypothetical protein AGDE_15285 [Angomonas deanei]
MTRHVAASYYHQQQEEGEEEPAGKKEKSEKSEVEKNGERLLYSLGQAYVWPPLSFREEEVIQDRLAQIDRLLGPENNNNENSKKGSDITRRLLSTKRLIQLSFNRLQHALHRKNTLPTLFPGFHQSSVVDTQLCLPAYDAYYKQAMEALEYGGKLEERWKERTGQLRAAGDLIAYCIQYNQEKNQNRNDKSLLSVSQEEIVRGLEEDDATWLNHNETEKQKFKNKSERSRAAVEKGKLRDSLLFHNNNKEDKTLSLSTILAEFRVTRFTSRIKDVWRSLWRQAQLERDVTDENTNEDDFLENPAAQRMMREKVEDNIRNRYSLHAALASEIFILQCEAYEKEEKIKESELLLLEKQRKSEHAALSAYQPKKANKVSIPPKKETTQKKNRPPPPPSLLHCMPFEFACSKIAKEYNMELKNNNNHNTIWPSKNMHYMEVGPSPTDLDHRATTAAIEIDRLMPILYELQNTCNENYKLRSQRAHTALSELAQVYDLRVASPQPKKNASLSSK